MEFKFSNAIFGGICVPLWANIVRGTKKKKICTFLKTLVQSCSGFLLAPLEFEHQRYRDAKRVWWFKKFFLQCCKRFCFGTRSTLYFAVGQVQISDNGLDNELNGFESKHILTHVEQRRCNNSSCKAGVGVPLAFLCQGKSWVLLLKHRFLRDQWTSRLNTTALQEKLQI